MVLVVLDDRYWYSELRVLVPDTVVCLAVYPPSFLLTPLQSNDFAFVVDVRITMPIFILQSL